MTGAVARHLGGGRLHLQHGPIDMIAVAEGPGDAVREALVRGAQRFHGLLEELVADLRLLRQPVGAQEDGALRSPVARAMAAAARRHLPAFVTPMAAVAGAGAQAVLEAMLAAPGLTRAHVNNGGDIALHLAPGAEPFRLGVVVDPAAPASPGRLLIGADAPWRGVATSGAPGRSHSLGIADSVTVLAGDAPAADVAATLLANAVDLPGDPAVQREPASHLAPDSDLGERPVTVAVGALTPRQIARALDAGEAAAGAMLAGGLIGGAMLVLRGQVRLVGDMPLIAPDAVPLGEPAHA